MAQDAPQEVLITGGTGFIGTALAAQLAGDGWHVTVLSRDAERATRHFADRGLGGVTCIEDAAAITARPHAVVNLAGAGIADRPWTKGRRAELRDSRIDATQALLAALGPDRRPETLVSASAVGYYGDRGDGWVKESDAPGDGFAAELCRDWEAAATASGVRRVVCLRIGLVLGDGGLLGRLKLPFSLGLGGRIGSGEQYMPWIHLDDVVGIIRFALDTPALEGPVNTVAPAPATNRAFTAALGAVLKRPTILPVPAFALRLGLGAMAEELLLGGQRPTSELIERSGYRFRHPDLEGAIAAALGRDGGKENAP